MPFHFPASFDLNDMHYFVQVVEHGGFAAAGRALNQPKSKLSRRIAVLEERLGVRLIQRSARRFVVTDIGQAYYQRCVAMLVEAEAAQTLVETSHSAPRGVVRLTCPTALLDYHLGDTFGRFLAECPDVELQVESTNRQVDVIQEGFDLAIRVRFPPLEDSDLVMKVLGESRQLLVASPALVERMGGLPTIGDIERWPSLSSFKGGRDRVALWRAAVCGVGVAQLPLAMVRADLQSGRLIELLPGWQPRVALVHVVFPSRRGLLPAVRALLDFLAKEFADRPA